MEILEIAQKFKHLSKFSEFCIFQAIHPPEPLINQRNYCCFCNPVDFAEIMIFIKKAKICEKIVNSAFSHFQQKVTFCGKWVPGHQKYDFSAGSSPSKYDRDPVRAASKRRQTAVFSARKLLANRGSPRPSLPEPRARKAAPGRPRRLQKASKIMGLHGKALFRLDLHGGNIKSMGLQWN